MMAADNGHYEVVSVLLKHDAQVDLQNKACTIYTYRIIHVINDSQCCML